MRRFSHRKDIRAKPTGIILLPLSPRKAFKPSSMRIILSKSSPSRRNTEFPQFEHLEFVGNGFGNHHLRCRTMRHKGW